MTIDECKVEITNHPVLTDVKRTVKYNGLVHDPENSIIIVKCLVIHKNLNDVELTNYIPNQRVDLVTDRTSWIDTTTFDVVYPSLVAILDNEGNVVNYENQYPAGSTNEYNYWLNLFENPIDLYPLLQQMIGLRASQGKFD